MGSPDEIRRTFSQVPSNAYLGFELTSQSGDEAVVSMKIAEHHIQETGVVHGGFMASVADTAAVYVLRPYLHSDQSVTSIEFKMNFLRPATRDGGDLLARSRLLRRGRKVGVCEVEVMQADAVVAKGLFTYLFLETAKSTS